MGRKKCPHVDTMEKVMCAGKVSPVCPAHSPDGGGVGGFDGTLSDASDPHCAVTNWSEWSPCSVSCGECLLQKCELYSVEWV